RSLRGRRRGKANADRDHRQGGAPEIASRTEFTKLAGHKRIHFSVAFHWWEIEILLMNYPRRYRGLPRAHRRKRSIPDVLQEPLCRDLAAEPGAARRFVHLAGDRVELGALQVAALRIADLVGRGAASHLALHQISKRHALVGQRIAMLAPAAAAIAMLALAGAGFVADVLRVGGKLRMTNWRRRVAEAQIDVDAPQAFRIGLAGAPDHHNVGAL